MDWKLEVVVVPVTDVDRAKHFYSEQVGFVIDLDMRISDEVRVVQLTPPGSACSIHLNTSPMLNVSPGAARGLQLVVGDVRAARTELVDRGVEIGEVQVLGASEPRPARDGEDLQYVGCVFFNDPDGNGWVIQEIHTRG